VNIIDELGIEIPINPVLLSASEITRYLNGGRILSIAMLLGGHAEVMEIIAQEGSKIIDNPLHKLDLPKGIIIGAVVKGKKVYIPDGKTVIHSGDRVVVFCLKEDLSKIEPYFYKTKRGILNELWNSSKNHR
jgi:trk system potassium uptake protein TrkA